VRNVASKAKVRAILKPARAKGRAQEKPVNATAKPSKKPVAKGKKAPRGLDPRRSLVVTVFNVETGKPEVELAPVRFGADVEDWANEAGKALYRATIEDAALGFTRDAIEHGRFDPKSGLIYVEAWYEGKAGGVNVGPRVRVLAGFIVTEEKPVKVAKAGTPKAGTPKAGTPKAGTPKAGTPKAGTPKAGTPKAGTPKAGTPKAGTPKAGTPKAGTPKAGTPKAGTPKATAKSEIAQKLRKAYVLRVATLGEKRAREWLAEQEEIRGIVAATSGPKLRKR
jgi:hypothetical protein